MKIAVFIKSTTFRSSYGGLETQNKLLCEGLIKRGHEVTVFTPQSGEGSGEREQNGVRYIFVDAKTSQYSSVTVPKSANWETRSVEIFREKHRNTPFDLVIGQSSGAVGIIRNRQEFGIPIISISHGTKIGELQTKLKTDPSIKGLLSTALDLPHVLKNFFTVQREFIHGSNTIIAVSNSVKKALVEETFVDENKIIVINNGINPFKNVSATSAKQDGKFHLLYVGQLIKSKGIGRLAQLLASSDFSDFTLDIVGSGELESEIVEYSKKSNGRITLHGKLPYDDVIKMYDSSRFDAFVFPTARIEGFPMVLVEAMFGALPVVAFDLGGVSDAVVDGKTGFLVKPGNFKNFIEKLDYLRKDKEFATQLGKNGLEKAMNEFTIDTMLNSYEKIFIEVKI